MSSPMLEDRGVTILDPNLAMDFEVELKALSYMSEELSRRNL